MYLVFKLVFDKHGVFQSKGLEKLLNIFKIKVLLQKNPNQNGVNSINTLE